MWIIKIVAVGFFTAIGWYGAEAYVIDPYLKKHNDEVIIETKRTKEEE